jgi:hypothetical protein
MKKLLNAVLQIDQSQHLSQERIAIGHGVSSNYNDFETHFVNVSDLTPEELEVYQSFKQILVGRIPQ